MEKYPFNNHNFDQFDQTQNFENFENYENLESNQNFEKFQNFQASQNFGNFDNFEKFQDEDNEEYLYDSKNFNNDNVDFNCNQNINCKPCLDNDDMKPFTDNDHFENPIGSSMQPPCPSLDLSKHVNKASAEVGDILTYTIVLKNTGNVNLTCIKVRDHLPCELDFIEGSLYINDKKINCSISKELTIDCLAPSTTCVITFKARIKRTEVREVKNFVEVCYMYEPCGGQQPLVNTVNAYSPATLINILNVKARKTADKPCCYPGEIVTICVDIVNCSNTKIRHVVLNDCVPKCAELIPHSIRINGDCAQCEDLKDLCLGNFEPGEKKCVCYDVKIKCCKNTPVCDFKEARIDYSCSLDCNSPRKSLCTNNLAIKVNTNPEKDIEVSDVISVPCSNPDLWKILGGNTCLHICSYELVNNNGRSFIEVKGDCKVQISYSSHCSKCPSQAGGVIPFKALIPLNCPASTTPTLDAKIVCSKASIESCRSFRATIVIRCKFDFCCK